VEKTGHHRRVRDLEQRADQQPVAKLSPKFVLTPLLEYQNGSDHFVRISKVLPPASVVSVTPSQSLWPAAPLTPDAQKRYVEAMKRMAESRQKAAAKGPPSAAGAQKNRIFRPSATPSSQR